MWSKLHFWPQPIWILQGPCKCYLEKAFKAVLLHTKYCIHAKYYYESQTGFVRHCKSYIQVAKEMFTPGGRSCGKLSLWCHRLGIVLRRTPVLDLDLWDLGSHLVCELVPEETGLMILCPLLLNCKGENVMNLSTGVHQVTPIEKNFSLFPCILND